MVTRIGEYRATGAISTGYRWSEREFCRKGRRRWQFDDGGGGSDGGGGGSGGGGGGETRAKAFEMAAKETAVSPLWCVRQPGYISRVNDSGISISVSVRWLSLPTLPG